ncbi:MAG: hypothetical protein IKJ57_02965, partial [Oscillospiraceae bacterium]|nr:hypothetical protein [Oscillospiraceae bacterium]
MLPENSDISVDPVEKKITADLKEGWTAVKAEILVGGEVEEEVTLTDGVGTYEYPGNAFDVRVNYAVTTDIAVATQQKMIDAMASLKKGTTDLVAAYAADTNLGTVVLAMPALKTVADGIFMDFGFGTMTLQFGATAIEAVNDLNSQLGTEDESLDLQDRNIAYNTSASKTEYFVKNGAAYKATLIETYNNLNAIYKDPIYNNTAVDSYLQGTDNAKYVAWMAFKNILAQLIETLQPIAEAEWTTTNLVNDSVNYETLDTLVAALGEASAIGELKETLNITELSVTANMNRQNVTVEVVLNYVKDNEVVKYDSKSEVITLDKGADKDAIIAAVEDSGFVNATLASWDAYVEGKYAATTSTLPETLEEDITYTITYNPVVYTITADGMGLPASAPYGYKLTLPVHEDANDPDEPKAYDYTVNGKKFAQGSVVAVEGDTVITREEGKSYQTGDLYSIVAGNFANDAAKDILTSGALKGNVVINYRQPDPTDEGLVKLEDNQVIAEAEYSASYADLNWKPYKYGANGTENSFSGNTAAWTETSVKATYILNLDNFGEAKAKEIIDLAVALKEEADGQLSVLNKMAGYYSTMGQLDKTKLGALNGVIDVTDFSSDAAKNDALKAYFKAQVSSIIANNLDSNNQLKIYNMLGEYKEGGLGYYYENSEAVINEIDTLSSALSAMLVDEEKVAALETLVTAAQYPEYAEKIANLEGVMAEVKANLTAPNALIDLGSKNLGKLMTALTEGGTPSGTVTGSPYIVSPVLTAADASQVFVQVIIKNGTKTETVTSEMITRGNPFTAELYTDLINKVNAAAENVLVGSAKYYDLTVEGIVDDLKGLIGVHLMDKQDVEYNYTPKTYTVNLNDAYFDTITIEDSTINLPKHGTTGWEYRYTIDGVEGITYSTYTFTAEQIDRLFTDGVENIIRVEANAAAEGEEAKFEEAFGEWIDEDENGNTILFASIEGDKGGLEGFIFKIVNSGYSYIGLNGEPLLYMNSQDTLEVKLQTLINAILKDATFSSEKLIKLGKAGKGDFVTASMQLGNSENELTHADLPFTLNFKSVPGQMVTVANGLEAAQDYITFNSNPAKARSLTGKDVLDINVKLPEKVYEVYLAALLATGNVDKDDMNAIDNEIAIMFLYDYIDLLVKTDATTTTYTNTLKKLGIDKDLTKAEDYYKLAKKAFKHLDVNTVKDDTVADVVVSGNGRKGIDGIVNLLGLDISAYSTYIEMIYEYKDDGQPLTATANVKLLNTESDFEAALVDVKQPANKTTDHLNKFDFTKDLPNRVKTLAGEAAVILLDTVDGDLVFDYDTILDLNGKIVKDDIVANAGAKVLIFDSSLDTFSCGVVEGTVSGNVTIVGGKYPNCNVEGFLPDGYVVEDDVVRNVLYTIDEDNGDVLFKADADIIDVLADGGIASYTEAATAIAADMAVDLVLNYFTSASLKAGVHELYNIELTDIIGLYDSTNRKQQLIDQAIEWVSLSGLNGFINDILDQMINFAAIEDAIDKDQAIVSFEATVAPWSVTVEHKTAGDYITFGIAPNEKLKDTFNVGLVLDGEDAKQDYAEKLFGNLAEINETADAQVEILKPTFNNNHLTVHGKGNATFIFNVTNKHLGDNADFTNEEYINVLAVVLANGVESAKAKALTDAIKTYNAENTDDRKAVIDNVLTVKDVFDALKKLNKNDTFANIANDLGVAVKGNAEDLEEIYHLIVVAAGKALEVLDVTGPSKTLGSLYNSNSGYYELNVDRSANKSVSRSGYTLTIGAEITELILKVKLFDDGHVHTEARRELVDHKDPTCKESGYDKFDIYCVCGHKMGEDTVTIPATGNHTPKPAVRENEVPATCTKEGSYDSVVYCDVCGDEISRTPETIDKLDHE